MTVGALGLLDPASLLGRGGAAGAVALMLVLFCETGLLVGFFLPGDSLLFSAGVLCAGGSHVRLSLPVVLWCAFIGAAAGSEVGYLLGEHAGRPLLERPRSARLQSGVDRVQPLLRRYGVGRVVVLSRFVPLLRTVVSPLAGALGVPRRTFLLWQVASAVLWTGTVVLLGDLLGTSVPGIDRYLPALVALAVAVSLVPAGLQGLRVRRRRQRTAAPAVDDSALTPDRPLERHLAP